MSYTLDKRRERDYIEMLGESTEEDLKEIA